LRRVLFLVSALFLGGCTDSDWGSVMPGDAAAPAQAPVATEVGYTNAGPTTPITAANPSSTLTCTRVARERSGDAQVQGFDDGIQRNVYDKTYAECLKWSARAGQ
jgi:hypothetical protein